MTRAVLALVVLAACGGSSTKPSLEAPRLLEKFVKAKNLQRLTVHMTICVAGSGQFESVTLLPPDDWPELEAAYADQLRHARWETPKGVPPGEPFCMPKVVKYVFRR